MITTKNRENFKNRIYKTLESTISMLRDHHFKSFGDKLLPYKFILRFNSETENYSSFDLTSKEHAISEILSSINDKIKDINNEISLNLSVSATFEVGNEDNCLIEITPSYI